MVNKIHDLCWYFSTHTPSIQIVIYAYYFPYVRSEPRGGVEPPLLQVADLLAVDDCVVQDSSYYYTDHFPNYIINGDSLIKLLATNMIGVNKWSYE